MEWSFQVKGSAPQPYSVKFQIKEKSLKADCSCPDSSNGYCCKHILGLLMTNTQAPMFKLFDSQKQEQIKSLLQGITQTEAFPVLQEFLKAKKQSEEAKMQENRKLKQLQQLIIPSG